MAYTIAANTGPAIPRGTLVTIIDARLTEEPRLPIVFTHTFGQKVSGILDQRALSGNKSPRRISVLTSGTITGVDTSMYSVGDKLYSTTNGAYSDIALPGSQEIGEVTVSSAEGEILVAIVPQNPITGNIGTKAEFNAALSDGDFLFVGDVAPYTDEMAQDAVGGILADSVTINFTYDDTSNTITANVQGLTSSDVSNFVEAAQDAIGAMLDATITYADGAPSLGVNLNNANNWAAIQNFLLSTGIGTTSPTSKLDVTTNSLGTTQTDASGVAIINTTPAAAGAQQISPALRLRGNGWKTNATAGSQTVDFRLHVLPIQGAASPTANLLFQYSVNGGAYTTPFTLSSIGEATFASNVSGAVYTATNANNGFILSGIGRLRGGGSDGVWRLTNGAETGFGRLVLGSAAATNPAIKRNGAGIAVVLGDDSGFSDIEAAKVVANNVVRLKGYTVATLPAGMVGDTCYVTDALSPTYNTPVVGGGAVVCRVFYNGSAWIS